VTAGPPRGSTEAAVKPPPPRIELRALLRDRRRFVHRLALAFALPRRERPTPYAGPGARR
jgi:hypothetical protein